MNLKIALCDDDCHIIQNINSILQQFQIKTDHNLTVDTYTTGWELIAAYQCPGTYDIIFLDVEMPEINGIDVAREIRSLKDRNVNIIFVSSYPEYMQNSFSVHPFHYLQKPITTDIIHDVMLQIINDIQESHTLYTLVDTYKNETSVNIQDIQYISVVNSKMKELCFHLKDTKLYVRGMLGHWKKELQDYNFFLCRRDILINLTAIHYFTDTEAVLYCGEKVPISRGNRKKVHDIYFNQVVISKKY